MRRFLCASFTTLAVTGCSGSHSSTPQLLITSAPVLSVSPNAWAPLVAVVAIETSVPTEVSLQISDGTASWTVDSDDGLVARHPQIAILGLHPGRAHTVLATVRDERGRSLTAPTTLAFTTPALPADFPPIRVTTAAPARMQAGNTMLNIVDAQNGDKLVMLDPLGEVVWYLDHTLLPQGATRPSFLATPLPNGHFMLIVDRCGLVEVDMLGHVHGAWWANNILPAPGTGFYRPVAADSFHHDVLVLPADSGAAFATLSTERVTLPNYPNSVVDPSLQDPSAEVVGDVIVEFASDGAVVREIPLLAQLDPYRMCYDTLGNYWDDHYGTTTRDWSHGNALCYDANDNSYVVSLRHQEAIVKLDRTSGLIDWILGPPERWLPQWQGQLLSPMPGLDWQYHQHAPELLPGGRILVFDNGDNRAVPPAPGLPFDDSWSRAVEFKVDGSTRTVAQTWAYGQAPDGSGASFYSFFVGDANTLDNGNILVCDGGKLQPAPHFNLYARIAEVTHTTPPEVVFEAYVLDESSTAPKSYFVYRAFRVPALHP